MIVASDTLYPGKPWSDTEAFFAMVSELLVRAGLVLPHRLRLKTGTAYYYGFVLYPTFSHISIVYPTYAGAIRGDGRMAPQLTYVQKKPSQFG